MQKKKTKSHAFSIFKFFIDNWFLAVFFACIAFVGLVSFYKLFVKPENFVYARVKVAQGLWWASTQRPPTWLTQSLKPGLTELDLTGKPKAQILAVRAYPYYATNQYETYVDLKLKVTGKLKNGTVNFNRSSLAIGAPIELAFPTVEITGTVMDLSTKPFTDKLKWKSVVLVKNAAYQWEYDAINIGDSYFDGTEKVFEVVDKQLSLNPVYGLEPYGTFSERSFVYPGTEARYLIKVIAKIKIANTNNTWLYGLEQELRIGKPVVISTNDFYFQDYQLAQISP